VAVDEMLLQWTPAETAPKADMEVLFVHLRERRSAFKALTIESYFQSPVGFKYVRYKGDSHTFTFPGCTHPEHKTL
jgi:hypothetical protein